MSVAFLSGCCLLIRDRGNEQIWNSVDKILHFVFLSCFYVSKKIYKIIKFTFYQKGLLRITELKILLDFTYRFYGLPLKVLFSIESRCVSRLKGIDALLIYMVWIKCFSDCKWGYVLPTAYGICHHKTGVFSRRHLRQEHGNNV